MCGVWSQKASWKMTGRSPEAGEQRRQLSGERAGPAERSRRDSKYRGQGSGVIHHANQGLPRVKVEWLITVPDRPAHTWTQVTSPQQGPWAARTGGRITGNDGVQGRNAL